MQAKHPAGKRRFPNELRPDYVLTILLFVSIFTLSFNDFKKKPLPPAPNVTTELRFNEGVGTTAADGSGNGHTATLTNGPTWVAGKYGQAVNLDGTNDYLSVADHANFTLDPTQSYTWSGWIRNTNFRAWSTVWSQTLDANNFFYFYAHTTTDAEAGPVTNGLSVYWYNGSNKVVLHSNNNVLTANTWSYVTVTYNGSLAQNSRFTIYVNGTDVTNRTDVVSTGTIASINPTNTRIGSNQPYGDYFTGAVDDIRYYRRLLSAAEIQSDMNTADGPDTVLPTATITAPAAGNVSGTINVTATASDNIGVAGVQFLLDGVALGAEDLNSPYTISWNTTGASNGNHTLTARARDAAGNFGTSAAVVVNVNNDVTLPTINITAPAAGNVSGTLNVTADANDNVGVVGVQFLLDGVSLGSEDLSAPWSVSWNTTGASNGSHTLTARARDAAGNQQTSSSVVVSVNNDATAPTVSITAPSAGNVQGTIDITADANDNTGVAGVQFLLDGVNFGSEDLAAPYTVSWNTTATTNGNHTLTARARDAAGNATTSAQVVVNVNNPDAQLPTVSITAPAAGNVAGTINVSATASDNVGVIGVQFQLDGQNLSSEDLTAPYTISWNTTGTSNGNHTLTAIARDAAGNQQTSASVLVNVNNDVTSPSVNITAPAAGDVSGTINVTANATDNVSVVGVQFQLDGSNLGSEDLAAPYSVSWNTSGASNGSHTLTAIARDAAGNQQTSVSVIVNVNNFVDTQNPVVSITAPAAGNVSGTINVTADATDNVGVVGVQFLLDGANLGSEDVSAPYSFSWNTVAASNGSHTLTARARDAAGNQQTSASVIVTVNNVNTNLITAIHFNENTGTTAADISGNGHTATLTNGPTWVAGKYGQAVNMDGTNDYLNIADHANFTLDPTQNYTWSAWILRNSFSAWSTVWSQTLDGNNFFYFYAHTSTDNEAGPVTNGISAYWYNGSSKLVLHSNNNVLTAGQWSYVTITYNASAAQASRFTIYVNGTDVTNRTDVVSSGTLAAINPTNIRIGANQPYNDYFAGAIDEFRYYKRLLTPAEITTDMNTPLAVDNTAPSVNVTSPANSATVSGTINVTADATDNTSVAGVLFLLDGVAIGSEDIAAPYSVSWNTGTASNGNHVLTARARDAAGNTTTSAQVTVTVSNDATAPTVNITAPAAGNVTGTLNVTADAADNVGVVGVQFLLDGVNLGSEDLVAPYSVSWNSSTASVGNHTLTAKARDAAGNNTTSSQVIVNVTDAVLPVVNITAPAAGNVSGTINVTATATDNVGVAGVQFQLDGVNLGTEDLSSPYSVSWNTTAVANGNHTLTAIARDAAGNQQTSSPIAVNVNNDLAAPTVNITGPAAGNVSGTINITADASDNTGVVGVKFLLDGVIVGSEDLTAPYSVSWNTTTATNTSHTLTAIARDAAGNQQTSAPVVVSVNNSDAELPVVNITAPAAGNVIGTISVTASASDNIGVIGVQFQLDGVNLSAEDLSAPYTVSWNTTGTSNGSHTLTAIARDAAGNQQTSAPVVVNVNNDVTGPTVAITAPAAGDVSGTINVTASATDNVSVVGVQFQLDGANLGSEDLAAPYTVSWNTTGVGNGTHTLTAIARDPSNNSTTSASVIVNVNNFIDTQNPVVSITAPAAGTVSGTVNVTADATDNVGVVGVQFLLDGVNLGSEDISAPYSYSWNSASASNGNHTLTARARDAAGNSVVSAGVVVNVSNNTNLIAAIHFNENTGTTAADISGNAHNGTLTNGPVWTTGKYGQGISLDGTNDYVNIADHNNFSLDPTQNYTWSAWILRSSFSEWSTIWSQTLDGNNFVYFYAHTSTDGEAGPVTNGISAYWYNGSSKVVLHTNNNVLTAGQWNHVTITYNASAAQASRFTIYVNGADVTNRTDVVSTGTIAAINPTNIRIGSNQPYSDYFAGSIDEVRYYRRLLTPAEITTDMNTPIVVDNTAPAVAITNPANGAFVSGTVNVTADATDNIGVAGVQFLLDGVNLGSEDQSAPYTASWNTATATGTNHVLTARARDAAGNITTSASVNVALAPDFTFTALNSSRNVEVTGSVSYGVQVAYLNGFTSSNVALSVTGFPPNVTASYQTNPMTDQGQTQLTITTNNATPGTYTLNLSAVANSITRTATATLIINGAADFSLSPSPGVQNVTAGNGTSYTINLNETGDFVSPVTLSVSGLPSGANASFNPASATPAASSILTITTSASTPVGTYNLTVQGASGSIIRTTPITLIVNSTPPATWPVTALGSGWDMPIGAVFSKDGQKLFVWEKGGKVYVCNRNAATQLYDKQTTPVLDISAEVGNWDDHGLNGFALDPNFATNGLIYLLYVVDRHYLMNFGTPNYNPSTPDNASAAQATIGRVTRYQTTTSGSNLVADLATRTILLGETRQTGIPVLHDSHGMGSLVFASDGTLLVSAGDGATYNSLDFGNNVQTYYSQALTDGIIRSEENVGAFRAQMLNSHDGKILRIDPVNGNGVSSNPFYDAAQPRSPKSRVYAMGLRNPFRINIRPGTGSTNPAAGDIGEIYIGDVGWRTYEELNIVTAPGQNFGWPIFEGVKYEKADRAGEDDYAQLTTQNRDEPNPLFGTGGCTQQYLTFNQLIKQTTADGANTVFNPCNSATPIGSGNRYVHKRPSMDWKHFTDSTRIPTFTGNNATFAQLGSAASGADGDPFPGNCSIGGFWYTGNLFPANFRNTYFFADYGEQWIKSTTIDFTDRVQTVGDFMSTVGGISCLTENPLDGTMVFVDIATNSVKRVSYGGNQLPVVKMSSDKTYGTSPLTVNFIGNTSYDPDGGPLTYSWNFGDATTSTQANPAKTFTVAGGTPKKYTVVLTVKDNQNATATDSIIISVNNTPPVVNITSPIKNSTYTVGPDSIYAFTATVTDAEHTPGQLRYEWQKFLRHNNHEHASPIDTARNTFASVARIGCNGEDYYWLIRLKVSDAAGLSTEDSSKIFPDCSGARVTSVFEGFTVTQLDDVNLVEWSTDKTSLVDQFEVEVSSDGYNFYTINTQSAVNIDGTRRYSFYDNSFPQGVNYYRLKMIGDDKLTRYSGRIKTFSEIKGKQLVISPNPVMDNFTIRYDAKSSGTVLIRITDANGRLIKSLNKSVSKGENILYMKEQAGWKPGMYLVSVQQGNTTQQGKLLYQVVASKE